MDSALVEMEPPKLEEPKQIGYRPSILSREYLDQVSEKLGDAPMNTVMELIISSVRTKNYTMLDSLL